MTPAAFAALATTLVLWGSAFAAIGMALQGYGPGALTLGRFLVASAALGVYGAIARIGLPRRADLPVLALSGLFGVTLYHLLLNFGRRSVTAGSASLLISTSPIFTAVLAAIFLRERIGAIAWLGIAISFLGTLFIALGESQGRLQINSGALLILASAIASAVFMVFQKPLLKRYDALRVTAWSIWVGTAFLLPWTSDLIRDIAAANWRATAALVYLGIFPAAVAYVTWAYVMSHVSASRAASFLYLIPAVAIVFAWVLLGEVPHVLSLIGGAIAIAGTALVNRRARKGRDSRSLSVDLIT